MKYKSKYLYIYLVRTGALEVGRRGIGSENKKKVKSQIKDICTSIEKLSSYKF